MLNSLTPSKLYGWSIVSFFAITFIGIPVISMGHSGGEQVPLVTFYYVAVAFIWIFFFLSIATTIFFFAWFKKYWYINTVLFAVTGFALLQLLL
ncbi:hypothetical protein [Pedobacter antarcticus]|uniref:hypothetical protein n=1 Tax=Pedobacter antarcticus TaxID=34086 RepID=UPI002930A55A|nr:hypothetical protein [Pedobacter antarcticus]